MSNLKITQSTSSEYTASTTNKEVNAPKKANSKKTYVPVGQHKSSKAENNSSKAPTRPKPEGIKNVRVEMGDNLFDIATKYHVSINDVLAANPKLDPDKIKEGQTLKMPYVSDKSWKLYINAKEAYEAKELKEFEASEKSKQAQKLKQRITLAQNKIKEANELKYNEDYNFNVDAKTGNIVITLKEAKELGDIRSDFKLPAGHLKDMNPQITKKYKPGKMFNLDQMVRKNDWDSAEANKGDKFVVKPEAFNPYKGFFGELFD